MRKPRYIVHVDMDAFFASVEQLDHPEHMGKPVIVGADPAGGKGRGVVAACSYEARKFGIHSAMPISHAYNRCPAGIFLRPRMERYAEISHMVFCIFERFTPDIEPISVDEAFLDISGSFHLFGTPEDTCRKIKETVKQVTGLTASVGLAPNMMTAKIASDLKKPDGLVIVTSEGLTDFLDPLPVSRLWGVGERTLEHLHNMGIRTIGALARTSGDLLEGTFGKSGRHLWLLARGIDERPVESGYSARSVSNEYTFNSDSHDEDKIKDVIMQLSEKVSHRMRKDGLKGRTITLKIRFTGFQTFTRATTLERDTNYVDDIYKGAASKLVEFDIKGKGVRLVGVKVSNLASSSGDILLFDMDTATTRKKERLHAAIDRLIDKFGEGSLRRRA